MGIIREFCDKFAQGISAGASGWASLAFTMAWLDRATQRASVREPNELRYASWERVIGKTLFVARTRDGWVAASRAAMENYFGLS
jgi:hypothetical protein